MAGCSIIDTKTTDYFLAIESGGSGTRLALADPSGRVLRLERCGSGSSLYRQPAAFATAFNAALEKLLKAVGATPDQIHAIGLTGPMDGRLLATLLDRECPGVARTTWSEGDVARALHHLTVGVALVAGTGCSCSALNESGALTSLGGYGPQFGDEGSAYWIGREGLKAAFLAEQHRIGETALLDAARAFYDVVSPWGIHDEVQGTGHVPAPRVAAFAAEVDRVAHAHDPRAQAILDEAGGHLGQLILDTTAQARIQSDPVPLVMTGGTLRSGRIVAAIERHLADTSTRFTHFPVVHEPVDGLIRLLQRKYGAATFHDVS